MCISPYFDSKAVSHKSAKVVFTLCDNLFSFEHLLSLFSLLSQCQLRLSISARPTAARTTQFALQQIGLLQQGRSEEVS